MPMYVCVRCLRVCHVQMSGPETKKAGGFNPKHHKTRIYKHKQKNPLTSRR